MTEFTKEAYEKALEKNESEFCDQRKFVYTFEKAVKSIDDLTEGVELEERMYNIKEEPKRWIGVLTKNAFLYMPDGEYFKSKEEEWNKCKKAVKENPFSITHKITKTGRPIKFYRPKACNEEFEYKVLDDDLEPMTDRACCDNFVYALFNDKN